MNNGNITREKLTLYMLPHKLKWYQKILQKLHIKNYYKKVGTTVETLDWRKYERWNKRNKNKK